MNPKKSTDVNSIKDGTTIPEKRLDPNNPTTLFPHEQLE